MSRATDNLKTLLAKLDQAKGTQLEIQRITRAYRRELSDLRDVLEFPPSPHFVTRQQHFYR